MAKLLQLTNVLSAYEPARYYALKNGLRAKVEYEYGMRLHPKTGWVMVGGFGKFVCSLRCCIAMGIPRGANTLGFPWMVQHIQIVYIFGRIVV